MYNDAMLFQGSINPWIELAKWPFMLSNHTLIALFTGITERLGVQPGSPKHTHLWDLCEQMKNEIQVTSHLRINTKFVFFITKT